MLYPYFLMAPPPGEGGGNPLLSLLPLLLIVVVFWFFILRPQQKKEKQRQNMISAVKKGDKVVTIGGIHGKVLQVEDTSVLVEVDANTKLRFEKTAIASVQA